MATETTLVTATVEIQHEFPLPPQDLLETDGEPLESDWHRLAMNLLIESMYCHFAARNDFYVGGNMFIYFDEQQTRSRDYRGPDFFFVWGVSSTPMRRYWAIWKEGGLFPHVIIELLSPSTARGDRTTKKDLYEQVFRTPNYFCYDPENNRLEGWTLGPSGYEALEPDPHGRLWCAKVELWLGPWVGDFMHQQATWLRFFTGNGDVVPIFAEVEAQRAQTEAQRAQTESARAAAAETQVILLREELEALRRSTDKPGA